MLPRFGESTPKLERTLSLLLISKQAFVLSHNKMAEKNKCQSVADVAKSSAAGASGKSSCTSLNLETLGEKLEALGKANKEKLDNLQERSEQHVVCGFHYSLNVQLPNPEWKVSVTPGSSKVSERLYEWRHVGAPLEVADDVFNDHIDYGLSSYSDVVRLNETLCKVGSKYYKLLADKPETCKAVSIFIENLEIISSALDELTKLTEDAKDDVSGCPEVKESMEAIAAGAQSLKAKLGNQVTVSVSYNNDTRSGSAKRGRYY